MFDIIVWNEDKQRSYSLLSDKVFPNRDPVSLHTVARPWRA